MPYPGGSIVVLRTAAIGAELPMQLRGNSVRSCP
jgi:hypothetical protein